MGFKIQKTSKVMVIMVMMDMVSIISFRIYYNNLYNHFEKHMKFYNPLIMLRFFSISVKTIKTGKFPWRNRYPFYAQKQYILP